jgi:hypothetical protein
VLREQQPEQQQHNHPHPHHQGQQQQEQQQQQQKAAVRDRVLQQHWPAAPGTFQQELAHCNLVLVLLQLRRLLEQLTRVHELVQQLRNHVAAGGRRELQQQQTGRRSGSGGKAEGQQHDTQHAGDGAGHDMLAKNVELVPVSNGGVVCGGQVLPSVQEGVLLQPDTQWTDTLEAGLTHPLLQRN